MLYLELYEPLPNVQHVPEYFGWWPFRICRVAWSNFGVQYYGWHLWYYSIRGGYLLTLYNFKSTDTETEDK